MSLLTPQYESQITQKWTFDTTIWVASPIYALLSVIRQQMSPFDPFRGGVAKRGQCPLFLQFLLNESFPNTYFQILPKGCLHNLSRLFSPFRLSSSNLHSIVRWCMFYKIMINILKLVSFWRWGASSQGTCMSTRKLNRPSMFSHCWAETRTFGLTRLENLQGMPSLVNWLISKEMPWHVRQHNFI